MADFSKHFKLTSRFEGGYVNDPNDWGGETFCGISRVFNPTWKGWNLVDLAKKNGEIDRKGWEHSGPFPGEVRDFFKIGYWDRFGGDKFESEAVAAVVYDASVHMGVHRSVKFLQDALNILNKDQMLWMDIAVDGGFGSQSANTLTMALGRRYESYLVDILLTIRGAYHLKKMRQHPSQERYAKGFFSRLDILRAHAKGLIKA